MYRSLIVLAVFMLTVMPNFLWADDALIVFGPEELVMTDGAAIEVSGYSVPFFADWNNDSLGDLLVGEGGGSDNARVRVYLNVGTELHPRFADYFYVQSDGSNLVCPAEGCLGCFPRAVYWDQDNWKDLLFIGHDATANKRYDIKTRFGLRSVLGESPDSIQSRTPGQISPFPTGKQLIET